MSEPTIRDRVRVIERAMLAGNLPGARVREYLSVATALLGWCGRECVEADLAFNAFLAGCRRDGDKSAAAARIEAEDSPHYRRKREAEAEQANCEEIIRSLKVMLRSLNEEARV